MTEFQLPESFQALFEKSGFTTITPIQKESFPAILAGKNVLGVSSTGTGKTLAYLLPAILRLKELSSGSLLILAPSQELAVQIAEVARPFGKELGFKTALLVGGGNSKRQQEKLKEKPEILVGTPGRILEFLNSKKIKWNDLKLVILDEVDQLLKEENNLTEKVLRHGIPQYQLLGFSATATKEEKVMNLFKESQLIEIKGDLNKQITEKYLVVDPRKKVATLKSLSFLPQMQGLVFFNQLQDLGAAYDKLMYEGIPVASLASDEDKFSRKMALTAFKEGKANFLLTTDVAARGIDLPQLPYVLFYDLPKDQEQYLHRKGRTGRMGETGELLFIVSPKEVSYLKKYTKNATEVFLYGGKLQDQPGQKDMTKPVKKGKKKKK